MQGFDPSTPPFDRLAHQEVEELRAALDIGYFRPGEVIVQRGRASECLHVIIKGTVEERGGEILHAVLGPGDLFDSRAVVHDAAGEDYVSADETLCHLIPKDLLLRLIRRNAAFGAYFYADVSRKLESFAQQNQPSAVESVLRSRVGDVRYGSAVFIDGSATMAEAGRRMRDSNINSLFVRHGERIGVITGMNLSKAAVLQRLPLETPIHEICHFDVIAIDQEDFIVEALLRMTRHNKRRLAVTAKGAYVGFLEDIDILGLFAGNSQLIPGRIDRARSTDDLLPAAHDIQAQVERLHRQGIRVEVIAEITSDLNRRLYRRLFELVAPASIRENGCLLLMGSEGRGEQTVRTDQDNGILLTGEVPGEDLEQFRTSFSSAVEAFGFPPCPGNVMVRNPVWSQSVEDFVRQLRLWVLSGDEEAAMNIAIFSDAIAVAGRPEALVRTKRSLLDLIQGERAFMMRFAHLIETFSTPALGVITSLMASVGVGPDAIDIKRAGIFPIVHGVRTLALDRQISAPSTAARIADLVEAGALEPDFGRELTSVLRAFMQFRLRSQLVAVLRGTPEAESIVSLTELTAVDRDILRDSLRIVRQFRALIRTRYNLGVV